jgi:hypothetical protein
MLSSWGPTPPNPALPGAARNHELYATNRTFHLLIKPDNLTCYQHQAGQKGSRQLAQRLQGVGIRVHIVQLPQGHDPNSYFVAGATAADFTDCLERAQQL